MRRQREEADFSDTGVAYCELEVGLTNYPVITERLLLENTEVTIGDMHGNALKLLFFLIREKIFFLEEKYYTQFVEIYKKDINDLTRDDIDAFRFVVAQITLLQLPTSVTIRLLGDELADRGNNDFFTLLLLKKLSQSKATVEIIFSNHGYAFLEAFEKGIKHYKPGIELAGCGKSLTNLRVLLENKLVSILEVSQLVKKWYLPQLKLLSYTFKKTERKFFMLHTHALTGLPVVKALKKHHAFRQDFRRRKNTQLCESINKINRRFANIVMTGAAAKIFSDELDKLKDDDMDVFKIPAIYPVLQCLWSRAYPSEMGTSAYVGRRRCGLFYAHGHHGQGGVPAPNQQCVYNLDNVLGKSDHFDAGKYSVLYTKSA